MTDEPNLDDGLDWLQITIPVDRANPDPEEIVRLAADAARAFLERMVTE